MYQWYFKNQEIRTLNPNYEGQKSERLLITTFFPKHKGNYWCIAELEDASGRITSHHATLTAGTYT